MAFSISSASLAPTAQVAGIYPDGESLALKRLAKLLDKSVVFAGVGDEDQTSIYSVSQLS
jgi:hypothetical protein